jgi:hypothetical protein
MLFLFLLRWCAGLGQDPIPEVTQKRHTVELPQLMQILTPSESTHD